MPQIIPTIMPRVVSNQREKFDNDELFRKLTLESEVKYTGHRELSTRERQACFQDECREGLTEIAFVSTGTNIHLSFVANPWSDREAERVVTNDTVDFNREPGKVHLKSRFIMNGVCVIWRGWLDLHRLEGLGYMQFDVERAQVEDRQLSETMQQQSQQSDQQRHTALVTADGSQTWRGT